MPEKATLKRARKDLREGKSASTAAGEFVREEMDHIRAGKHGARSTKQAIAIGLSKARRAGIPLKTPAKGKASKATRKAARRDLATGQHRRKPATHSAKRSRAMTKALKHEPRAAASHRALSRHAHQAAAKRTKADRSASARKAARTRARNAAKHH